MIFMLQNCFLQTQLYQLIAMVGKRQKQLVVHIVPSGNCVPMYFVHMKASCDAVETLSQVNCILRLALKVSALKILDVTQCKHFTSHLKDQGVVVER